MTLQLIGVPAKAEKDEVVKSVMELKSAEIEEGYTLDTVRSRLVRTWILFFIFDVISAGRSFIISCAIYYIV